MMSLCDTKPRIRRHTVVPLCLHQDGDTPLLVAAKHGHLSVVEYLLERGADIEAKDNVSDVTFDTKSHTGHICIYVFASGRRHSADECCIQWSSISG